jgi:hypothetical protein
MLSTGQFSKEITEALLAEINDGAIILPDTAKLIGTATAYAISKSLDNTVRIVNFVLESKN